MSKELARENFDTNIKPLAEREAGGKLGEADARVAYGSYLLGLVEGGVITDDQYFDYLA